MKWFRFYHDAIDDPKVQRLPGDVFKFWVNLLCLASRSHQRGVVAASIEDIAFDVRLEDGAAASMMAELIRRDLIEELAEGYAIHNWDARQFKSDDVSERVAKYRNAQRNGDETLHETLQVTAPETLKPSVITDSQINRDTEGQKGRGADAPARPKRATQVPDDFTVSDTLSTWGEKQGYTPEQMRDQVPWFIDHYTSKGETRKDWDASFRTWMRRARDYGHLDAPSKKFAVHRGGRPSTTDAFAEVERELGYDDDTPDVIDATFRRTS